MPKQTIQKKYLLFSSLRKRYYVIQNALLLSNINRIHLLATAMLDKDGGKWPDWIVLLTLHGNNKRFHYLIAECLVIQRLQHQTVQMPAICM